ncbi:MAG: hypothetical protein LBV08_00355, partial [Clostridiales bacterium]|nr:hypothetical protein [Clostridiales bacterium]
LVLAAALYSIDGARGYILFLKNLFDFKNYNNIAYYLSSNIYYVFILIISIIISFYAKNSRELSKQLDKKPYLISISAAGLVLSIFNLSGVSTFLYQNF